MIFRKEIINRPCRQWPRRPPRIRFHRIANSTRNHNGHDMTHQNSTHPFANRPSNPDQKQGLPNTTGSSSEAGDLLPQLAAGVNASLAAALGWAENLWRELEHQRLSQQRLEAQLESLCDQLNLHSASLDSILSNLNNLRAEILRLSDAIRRVTERQEVTDHNLEQVRRLSETLDRKVDRLGADFIDRHVTEPLFKQFLGILASLRSLANSEQAQIREEVCALAQYVECLLDSHGL